LVKDRKKGRITQERFSKTPKGLYLVATLQVKEVKALITCSCKESSTKHREFNDKQENFKEIKLN